MSTESAEMPEARRQPHQVTGIPAATRQRPKQDLERLLEYIDGPFRARYMAIRRLNLEIKQVRTQENINNLLIEANDFRMELDMWIPMAERLYDELFDTSLSSVQAAAEDRKRSRGERTYADAMKTQARAAAAPLKEAVAQLKNTRDTMVGFGFSARDQLTRLTTDEALEVMVENIDIPESRFEAPIGEGLRRHIRNT
jgi:hypothetical protein